MPAEPEVLDGRRLRARYLQFRVGAAFAGEAQLWELGRLAWRVVPEERGIARLVAMMLAFVFCDAASRMEGRSINQESAQRWFDLIDQPLVRALDALVASTGTHAETALADMASAYAQISAEISN